MNKPSICQNPTGLTTVMAGTKQEFHKSIETKLLPKMKQEIRTKSAKNLLIC